jgi:hypothetical protein
VVEQLSSVAEVHHKVQFSIGLERVVEFDDERTFDFLENVAFG